MGVGGVGGVGDVGDDVGGDRGYRGCEVGEVSLRGCTASKGGGDLHQEKPDCVVDRI